MSAIDWNPALNDLVTLLAGLYEDGEEARLVARRIGLDTRKLNFVGAPRLVWMRIVEETHKRGLSQALIDVIQEDFPNIEVGVIEENLKRPVVTKPPQLAATAWKGVNRDLSQLEKIMGDQPTFLPISFLETGLVRSRSVVRIECQQRLGTGFLLPNNLLITNHHVIATADDARSAKVWFNYERAMSGCDTEVAEFALDPDVAFATSPTEDGDDWTAVSFDGDPQSKWGGLELAEVDVGADEFVNIIQHPGGMPKQIALYHNVVTFADDARVQYLTDTMPGSSGAPVFDSQWRVVALHHSGGWLREPGSNNVHFRNEGIHVRVLVDGLRAHGVLPDETAN